MGCCPLEDAMCIGPDGCIALLVVSELVTLAAMSWSHERLQGVTRACSATAPHLFNFC